MLSKDKILLIVTLITAAIYYSVPEFVETDKYPIELIFLAIPITVILMRPEIDVLTKVVLITPFGVLAGYSIVESFLEEYANIARLSFLAIPLVAIVLSDYSSDSDSGDNESKNKAGQVNQTPTLKRSNDDF